MEIIQPGYHVLEEEKAEKWLQECSRSGDEPAVISFVGFVRRVLHRQPIEAKKLLVCGLATLLENVHDKEHIAGWIRKRLQEHYSHVLGKVIVVVVPRLTPDDVPRLVLEGRQGEQTISLTYLFGSIRAAEAGHAFNAVTLS